MEKLNLSEIRIEFLEEPTRNFNHDNGNLWYDYDISAFIDKIGNPKFNNKRFVSKRATLPL